ncbi:hypothetical protein ZWY2020_009322 [Hordeum vulgare]|nr:hypothetical protein ZWY2020_009322 [Hordeum vulgare]
MALYRHAASAIRRRGAPPMLPVRAMASLLGHVEPAPKDPIIGVTEAFLADPSPDKVNIRVAKQLRRCTELDGIITDDDTLNAFSALVSPPPSNSKTSTAQTSSPAPTAVTDGGGASVRLGTTKLDCTAFAATCTASACARQPRGSSGESVGCCQSLNTAASANWSATPTPHADDDLPVAALAMTCCRFLLSLALAAAPCRVAKLVRVLSPRTARAASS